MCTFFLIRLKYYYFWCCCCCISCCRGYCWCYFCCWWWWVWWSWFGISLVEVVRTNSKLIQVYYTHSHFMLGLNPKKCSCQMTIIYWGFLGLISLILTSGAPWQFILTYQIFHQLLVLSRKFHSFNEIARDRHLSLWDRTLNVIAYHCSHFAWRIF